ncbi:glycosyltransferase family 2 protein [Janibacter sp. GS2]|uniref:glycosyltransferase family 2 protein n=1 Tax=Janibacter sp. GS2 TaxID=3442646 RepID=UPI003EB7807E
MGRPDDRLITGLAAALDPTRVHAYAQFAIRTRSRVAREVLEAAGATAALGRVIALSGEPDAHHRGLAVLDEVVARSDATGLPKRVVTLWAELLLRSGRDEELRALLEDTHVPLTEADRWMLRTDLLNPHRTTWGAGSEPVVTAEDLASAERGWLQAFNEVHAAAGLEPLRLRSATGGDRPYQRLEAPVADRIDDDLVTVVMSAYAPDRDLLLAVRGVMDQTWANLELLVVDDASPPGFQDLFDEAEALDQRVRVVRAPRNGGTYEARNRALSVARGRWMTFQDSDDWTHPRRVEHQVRHLQESPAVLANTTRTLRAHPDLTMTFVGYPAERLNASSLMIDRARVTRLLGAFDSTRKSGDTELPERLEAVRPGSVQDLTQPAPLAITQLREHSLSRRDFLPGRTRWDRLAYRDSYREWHRQIAAGRSSPVLPASTGRAFPLPRPSWDPGCAAAAGPVTWDVVVLGDLRWKAHTARRSLGVARASATAGLRTAVAHAEGTRPLSGGQTMVLSGLSTDARLGRLGLTNAHEDDECDLLVVTDPSSMLHLDTAGLQVGHVLVVADEPEPDSWSVAAVDRRCLELFGVAPTWGGPARAHDGLDGPSAVRLTVPDERWCRSDLATVTGDGWHLVGSRRGPAALDRRWTRSPTRTTLVIGHHLADSPRRWPASADDLQDAYPGEVMLPGRTDAASSPRPVELHGLQGLNVPVSVVGHPMRPPSWVSFAGTGMSAREFLSHIDVWVYFGRWDTAAEIATLEALGAGLPCVIGDDAGVADLQGPIRCVPPDRAREAIEELLTSAVEETPSSAQRQQTWSRTLRRWMPSSTARPAARHPDRGGADR